MEITFDVFTFPFKDEKWVQKFAIASLLGIGSFLVIPGLALYGYSMRVMRHTIRTGEYTLPDWDGFGELIGDGFKILGTSIIYFLPIIIPYICVMVIFFASFPDAAFDPATGEEAFILFQFAVLAIGGIVTILSFVLYYLISVALARAAAMDDFTEVLEFGKVWQMGRDHAKYFALAFVLVYGGYTVSSFLLYIFFILICLLPFAIGIYMMYWSAVFGALFGDAYRHATGMAERNTVLKEPAV